jgi:hypothetical protein
MPKAPSIPTLTCECGQAIEIPGRRIGDSVTCGGCRKLRVILRSKVKGELQAAVGAPGTVSDRLPEVQESLKRIQLRRTGNAARGVALYPLWAVLACALLGPYLSTVLTGQNLAAIGYPERGRRVQVLGVLYYVLLGSALLGLWIGWTRYTGEAFLSGRTGLTLPQLLVGMAILLAGNTAIALNGQGEVRAAFQAGARPVLPVLPAILGVGLLGVQIFFVLFVVLAAAPR